MCAVAEEEPKTDDKVTEVDKSNPDEDTDSGKADEEHGQEPAPGGDRRSISTPEAVSGVTAISDCSGCSDSDAAAKQAAKPGGNAHGDGDGLRSASGGSVSHSGSDSPPGASAAATAASPEAATAPVAAAAAASLAQAAVDAQASSERCEGSGGALRQTGLRCSLDGDVTGAVAKEDQSLNMVGTIPVAASDLATLAYPAWLNDEIMNAFFWMLNVRDAALSAAPNSLRRRSLFHSTFFVSKLSENGYTYDNVKRWTRKSALQAKFGVSSIFELDKVVIPVHVSGNHWCLAVIYMQEKKIQYYDSMAGSGMAVLRALLRWLGDESRERLGEELDEEAWTLVPTQMDETPQQHNGCDCGAFTCTAADFLSNGEALSYSQADMPHFRRRMVCRILQGPGSLAAEAGLE